MAANSFTLIPSDLWWFWKEARTTPLPSRGWITKPFSFPSHCTCISSFCATTCTSWGCFTLRHTAITCVPTVGSTVPLCSSCLVQGRAETQLALNVPASRPCHAQYKAAFLPPPPSVFHFPSLGQKSMFKDSKEKYTKRGGGKVSQLQF